MFVWSSAALGALLEEWEENIDGLRGVRKNSHIYKEIEAKLKEFGPSHKEIKNKIDNMSKKYRSELAKVGATGGSPSRWEYFDKVAYILQGRTKEDKQTDSTDFSTLSRIVSDLSHSSSQNEEESPGPSRKRRRDRLDEICEIAQKKLKVIEKVAEFSTTNT